MKFLILFFCSSLMILPSSAQDQQSIAQKKNSAWISYRDTYKAMLWFEKYSGEKQLIQSHLLISFQNNEFNFENSSLILSNASFNTPLNIDKTGRVTLPLLKQAYDENSELILHSPLLDQSTQVKFKSDITIRIRTDGQYLSSDLYKACEQALKYYNYMGSAQLKNKKCTGARFVFSKTTNGIQLKNAANQSKEKNVIVIEESQLLADRNQLLRSYVHQFDLSGAQKIIAPIQPLVIVPIIE